MGRFRSSGGFCDTCEDCADRALGGRSDCCAPDGKPRPPDIPLFCPLMLPFPGRAELPCCPDDARIEPCPAGDENFCQPSRLLPSCPLLLFPWLAAFGLFAERPACAVFAAAVVVVVALAPPLAHCGRSAAAPCVPFALLAATGEALLLVLLALAPPFCVCAWRCCC